MADALGVRVNFRGKRAHQFELHLGFRLKPSMLYISLNTEVFNFTYLFQGSQISP